MEKLILGSGYYYSRLPDEAKHVYQTILHQLDNGNNYARVDLPEASFTFPSGVTLHDVTTSVVEDNPQLFHLDISHFDYSRSGKIATVSLKKVYSVAEYQQLYHKLREEIHKIVSMAEHKSSDFQKLVFVHDYLANGITYYCGASDPVSQCEVHTVVGALLNRACVCDGYAKAFRLICNHLHIPCIVVGGGCVLQGFNGPHAWNYVRLNGKMFHVDVTWDSIMIARGSCIEDYFFLRKDQIFKMTHRWHLNDFHPADEDYPRKEATVSNFNELERAICESVIQHELQIFVQLSKWLPGQDELMQAIKRIVDKNQLLFLRINDYRIEYHEEIQYVFINFV